MDSTTLINQIAVNQAEKEVTANENFNAASPAMLFSRNAVTSLGLTWGYTGGRFLSTAIASGTLTLTASVTNYVVASATTGAVTVATTTTNWNNTGGYVRLYLIVTGASTVTSYEDHRQAIRKAADATQCIPIAVSDETTALTAGTAKVTFRMPFAFTLTGARCSVTTAPTGTTLLTVNIKKTGVTVFSTKLTIDASAKTSVTATTPAVISDSAFADDAEITIDVDFVGSTIAGAGLKVYLIGLKL